MKEKNKEKEEYSDEELIREGEEVIKKLRRVFFL